MKGAESKKRDFEEYMKAREEELRATWRRRRNRRAPVAGPKDIAWG
jgi:hypothetical protein